jgi:hypothetical protein
VNGTFHQGRATRKKKKVIARGEERINRQDSDFGEAEGEARDFKIGQRKKARDICRRNHRLRRAMKQGSLISSDYTPFLEEAR